MRQFTVTKEIQFDAGHRVPLHESACRNPHGHRYRVLATVSGPLQHEGAATGMVVDFSDIKALLQRLVHDRFDHGFIVWNMDILGAHLGVAGAGAWKVIAVPYHPTAENLAADIFASIAAELPAPLQLESIEVYETPTSVAKVTA